MAHTSAMRYVTVACDANHYLLNECGLAQSPAVPHLGGPLAGPVETVYAGASRWRCGLQPPGLCANLRLCDESTDSQAVALHAVHTRVNQLRNIALGTCRRRRNIPTGRSVSLDSGVRPALPQTFPQGSGVRRSDFTGPSSLCRDGACSDSKDRPRPSIPAN